uniref:Transposase n=1 Tax=Candidatus Kentrum sp. UNK TaxID=2126344 RepID=A0A451AYV7_9GAMM|nr:MAG: hypothetical protein BECKUNK1418G_GA0071005_105115 [Candidatus Kentron sp. UNK]VFK71242.1 MAG: hypothetical protein BECKUNK1418H_GA0071006_105615 [Candidatus Kentron sp. UNK]
MLYIYSDMGRGLLKIIAKKVKSALHVFGQFHLVYMRKAIDEVDAFDTKELKGSRPSMEKTC